MKTTKPTIEIECQICKKKVPKINAISPIFIRKNILNLIKETNNLVPSEQICSKCIQTYRMLYIEKALKQEIEDLDSLELHVIKSIKEHELLTKNLNESFDMKSSFGDKLSDRIAAFGGSWKFIIIFITILISWMLVNSVFFLWKPFDPYPFILLNLFLSSLAAFQAPIIMMSQNRQAARDRLRSEYEYTINLKAELEIRHINEKVDHLMENQLRRIIDIQQNQMDTFSEILKHIQKIITY